MVNRFKEFRRSPKEKRSIPDDKQIKTARDKRKIPGVDSILKSPSIPVGEDETSFQRHNKILILESKKAHPTMLVVSELMERTFAFRRKDILDASYDIETIVSKYPFLQNTEQVNTCFWYCV